MRAAGHLASILSAVCLLGCARSSKKHAPAPAHGHVNAAETEGATPLEALLELVPDHASSYTAVRDFASPAWFAEEAARFLAPAAVELGNIEDAPDFVQQTPGKLAAAVEQGNRFLEALTASKVDFDRGLLRIETQGGRGLVVFHSARPGALNALPDVFPPVTGPDVCSAINSNPGWSVCADDRATLDAYAPGGKGAALREQIEQDLPGYDLGRADAITGSTTRARTSAVTFEGDLVHMAVTGPVENPLLEQAFGSVSPNEARLVPSLPPGAGFVWGHWSSALLQALKSRAGPPNSIKGALADAAEGEFLFAGSAEPRGILIKAALTRQGVIAPLLDEMVGQFNALSPTAFPGLGMSAELAEVDVDGTTVSAGHLAWIPTDGEELSKACAGDAPHLWVLESGGTLTGAVGPTHDNIDRFVAAPAHAADPALPKPLRDALLEQRAGFAVHVPLDFVHTAETQRVIEEAQRAFRINPNLIHAVKTALAPVSSMSIWIELPASSTPVLHVVVRAIGDPASREGRAALDAAFAVTQGSDPAAAYGPLLKAHPDSPRSATYRIRGGHDIDGVFAASACGVLAFAGAIYVATGGRGP